MKVLIALLLAANISIPLPFFDEVKSVSFLSGTGVNSDTGRHAYATANKKTGEIMIYGDADMLAIIHEIGHFVCWSKKTPSPFGTGDKTDYISEYAKTSADEDCADTFGHYYLGRCFIKFWSKTRPVLAQKCQLIKSWDISASKKKS